MNEEWMYSICERTFFFVNVAMFVFTAGIKGIQSLLKSK